MKHNLKINLEKRKIIAMNTEKSLIEKKTIHAGVKSIEFRGGTKVKFHFQTRKCDAGKTLLDDSRTTGDGRPMELVLGKKFKLEVWEAIVQLMAVGEVAQFTVDHSLVAQYPFVAKTLRDIHAKKHERKHTCVMNLQKDGLGYEDLNELFKHPCDLEFTLELLEALHSDEYEKEIWQMDEDERIAMVSKLRESGNDDFKHKNYQKAAEQYAKAIGLLEQLQLREKPHDTEWIAYAKQQIPFLLNFAQCKLYEGDFYAVIEHCSTVLKTDPDNVKALFRRGKAHVGAWNPTQAREDFNKVLRLDSSLSGMIKKEITVLDDLIRTKDCQDKDKFKNMF